MPEHDTYRKYFQSGLFGKDFCHQIFQPVSDFLGNPVAFLFLLNDRLHTCFVVKQIPDSGKWRDPHDCRYITAADSFFAVFQPVFS